MPNCTSFKWFYTLMKKVFFVNITVSCSMSVFVGKILQFANQHEQDVKYTLKNWVHGSRIN